MNPTRVVAPPYKARLEGAIHESIIVPTDAGEFPLRQLSDMLGLARETLRLRVATTKNGWKDPRALQQGHYQVNLPTRGDNVLPRGVSGAILRVSNSDRGNYNSCERRIADNETCQRGHRRHLRQAILRKAYHRTATRALTRRAAMHRMSMRRVYRKPHIAEMAPSDHHTPSSSTERSGVEAVEQHRLNTNTQEATMRISDVRKARLLARQFRILALDLATKTGWATNSPEASGVDIFDVRRGESPGTRYLRFTRWLSEKIIIIRPELVVYEKAHHRGGAATEDAVGFATHLQSVCAAAEVEHAAIHTSTIKKYATDKGNAGKAEMMAAYQKRWGKAPIDDNECDARWLLEYAINRY